MSLLETINAIGLLSARPAAAAANEGYSYHATDEGITYRSNGANWDDVAINADGHAAIDHTGLTGVGGGAAAFAGVRARQSTNTNLTNGSVVYIGFDGTDDYDTDGYHDPASNNTRLTVPTGKAGKYDINGFSFVTSASGEGWASIRKNGTTVIGVGPLSSFTNFSICAARTTVELAETDYVEFGIRVSAASKQSVDAGVIDPTFEMYKAS